MLPLEHSAILLTCIKQESVLKTNFGLLFEWPLKTGFTVSTHIIGKCDITGKCNRAPVCEMVYDPKSVKMSRRYIYIASCLVSKCYSGFTQLLASSPVFVFNPTITLTGP